ncbi:HDL438Wp [Eremothecium sinecaudum]|uniref:HDL438Wp n=1 Tax=Eremothecium sinecaudum TaxID=45286 RepID=A0A0X8HQV6_9SACH|nr:HDL438Wp [Eremothecium sinecaudum]AMD20306.1 HDL438Wp [Eremothecium sinecaudum]
MQIINIVLLFLAKVSYMHATLISSASSKNIPIKNSPGMGEPYTLPSELSTDGQDDWETIESFRQSLRLAALKNNPSGADALRNFVSQQNSTCDEVNWYNVLHHSIFGRKRFCNE